uniref:NADH-ubiquinone oxidoreductase chain 5 n=1 Tax=Oligolophus tienmushanensis TaxID=1508515 RepID=A0A140X730_9ARAC|nr:NADH dehydrogenase subunit 5 [Oligolophus tienmushanensis]AIG60115.1 NADH dehydrogenase subunit 5 [Oligolophus tienmushanensis]
MSIFLMLASFLINFFFFFFFWALYLLLFNKIYLYEYELFSHVSSGGFILLLDWLGVMFFSIVLLISSLVFIYSNSYMSGDLYSVRFSSLVIMFILSMGLLVLSPNLMSLLLGWDGLGLISYALVIYYQNVRSFNAGMLTVLSNRLGDIGILLGIVALVNLGSWNFIFLDIMNFNYLLVWLLCCVVFAAMTKSAQIPFSAWLPAAMAAPTPVSSLVHSSTLVTAGVFLLIRFHDFFLHFFFSQWMLLVSLLTLLMSGVGACLEMDFKKVIALSTLSQLALMMFSLSIGLWELAYFHMLTHAIFKALLFLCAGSLIHSMGGLQDIRILGGVLSFSPSLGYGMLLSFLSLAGVPFSCGFYSKDLIIEIFLMMDKNLIYFILFFLGVFCTLIYSFRLVYMLLIKGYGGFSYYMYHEDLFMNFSIILLAMWGVFFGGMMSWLLFDYSNLIMLLFFLKLFTFSGLCLIFWMLLVFLVPLKFFVSLSLNFVYFYFVLMWYLSLISSFIFSNLYRYLGLKMFKGDMGWGEVLGGVGLSSFFLNLKFIQDMQYNLLTSQFIIILFLFSLMFLI